MRFTGKSRCDFSHCFFDAKDQGLLAVAIIVACSVICVKAVNLRADSDTIFLFDKWVVSAWVLELVLNAVVTALIVFRLWSIGSFVAAGSKRHPYRNVIIMLVETASLYTACLIVHMILYTLRLRARAITDGLTTQIAVGVSCFIWLVHQPS